MNAGCGLVPEQILCTAGAYMKVLQASGLIRIYRGFLTGIVLVIVIVLILVAMWVMEFLRASRVFMSHLQAALVLIGGVLMLCNLAVLNGLNETEYASDSLRRSKYGFLGLILFRLSDILLDSSRILFYNRAGQSLPHSTLISYPLPFLLIYISCWLLINYYAQRNLIRGLTEVWRDCGGGQDATEQMRKICKVLDAAIAVVLPASIALILLIRFRISALFSLLLPVLLAAIGTFWFCVQFRLAAYAKRTAALVDSAAR